VLCLATLPCEVWAQITVTNLQTPYSFVSSSSGKEYFISSVNGEPTAADNNGFITKLDANGKILNFKFVEGGADGITLHAPKGMALVEQTLYVADLDRLRAFDAVTGKPLAEISVTASPSQTPVQLTDVAYDGADRLYCSDQHGNRIYRVELPSQKVTLLVADPALAGPAGLAVHPKSGQLIAVSWDKGKIFSITPDGVVTEIFSNGFFSGRFSNLRGVDFDRWGIMYVSDFTSGKVWRMTWDKRFQVIAEYLPSPGDLGIDRTNNLILVPYELAHAAEMNGLEAPREGKSGKEKRTLADYGFIPPPPKPAEGAKK
jgi:DNA-binding beta-propeller fold protein YncE